MQLRSLHSDMVIEPAGIRSPACYWVGLLGCDVYRTDISFVLRSSGPVTQLKARIVQLEEEQRRLREVAGMSAEDAATQLSEKLRCRAMHLWSFAHKEELQEELVEEGKRHQFQLATLQSELEVVRVTAVADRDNARRFSDTVLLQHEEMLALRVAIGKHKAEKKERMQVQKALQEELGEWRELAYQLELKVDRLEEQCKELNTAKQCTERLLQSRTRQAETILRERDTLRSKIEKLERRSTARAPLTPRSPSQHLEQRSSKSVVSADISLDKPASMEDRALLALVRRLQQQLADTREQLREVQQGKSGNFAKR